MMSSKVVRQQLMQSAILAKIDREDLRIDTDRIRQTLRVTRDHVSRDPLMRSYLDRWEQIVSDNDIDAVRAIVAADDETAREMRNLSPLHVLLTEPERMQVLDKLRAWWTTQGP